MLRAPRLLSKSICSLHPAPREIVVPHWISQAVDEESFAELRIAARLDDLTQQPVKVLLALFALRQLIDGALNRHAPKRWSVVVPGDRRVLAEVDATALSSEFQMALSCSILVSVNVITVSPNQNRAEPSLTKESPGLFKGSRRIKNLVVKR